MVRFSGGVLLALVVVVTPLRAQGWNAPGRVEAERCTPWSGDRTASGWVKMAQVEVGTANAMTGVISWSGHESEAQHFQSDRPYPPFLASVSAQSWSYDPATGVTRTDGALNGMSVLLNEQSAFMVRDTMLMPSAPLYQYYRNRIGLNPHAVLRRFAVGKPQVEKVCSFRGYPRVVLALDGERLYLDEKTAMPVKFEYVEASSTWGQVLAEYVYTTWWSGDGVSMPVTAVRFVDGVEQLRRDVSLPQRPGDKLVQVVAREESPRLTVPELDQRQAPDMQSMATPVDTVRVADHTFLLATRQYTHAVTLQRDTVFLFDATMGDWRSRADSIWIKTLFPGNHPVVLVVTDLAWPHIGGVRFWAARGATIVSHRLSIPFLAQLLKRRWTLHPDELEKVHGKVVPTLHFVDGRVELAGGAVVLNPIDGVSSEGAVYASIPAANFVWAGDYIQDASEPSQYAREVINAMSRDGVSTATVAAQHLPLTPWSTILSVNPPRE